MQDTHATRQSQQCDRHWQRDPMNVDVKAANAAGMTANAGNGDGTACWSPASTLRSGWHCSAGRTAPLPPPPRPGGARAETRQRTKVQKIKERRTEQDQQSIESAKRSNINNSIKRAIRHHLSGQDRGDRRPVRDSQQGDRPGPTDQGGSPSGRPARDRSRNAPASVFGFPGFGTLRSHSTTDRKNSSPAHAKGRLLDGSIRERSPGRAQLPTLLDRDGRKCDAEQLAHEYAEIETAR